MLHFSVSFKGALQGLSFDFDVGSNPQIRLLDLSPPLHVKLQSDHSDQGPSSRKIDNDIKNETYFKPIYYNFPFLYYVKMHTSEKQSFIIFSLYHRLNMHDMLLL